MCLIGLIAGIHCDFFHSKGSGYGSIAPAYGAPAYGAPPAPASSYGYAPAAPASGYGYGAPAAYAPAVYYEEEKVSSLFIINHSYLHTSSRHSDKILKGNLSRIYNVLLENRFGSLKVLSLSTLVMHVCFWPVA